MVGILILMGIVENKNYYIIGVFLIRDYLIFRSKISILWFELKSRSSVGFS